MGRGGSGAMAGPLGVLARGCLDRLEERRFAKLEPSTSTP
jgi:hypothetical protein